MGLDDPSSYYHASSASKQQAASSKQQAASSKQQAGVSASTHNYMIIGKLINSCWHLIESEHIYSDD
ncbi:hypothetical protein [Aliikangiella sp. G2MR2-5]|uniref:hypothetical protein n=1 Tax=Aliikangiella sp. G2MR2-5 TaxID=2788943 RepID=UPI0018AAE654|nr:hypothetical protein [Aliikangiella sp. G2MR2-5]